MEWNFGKPLKKGNYNGKILIGRYKGLDYRDSQVAGTWNLYKDNRFVKHVGLELWDDYREAKSKAKGKKKHGKSKTELSL